MEPVNNSSPVFKQQHYFSDGSFERNHVLHKSISINHLAAFELLRTEEGKKTLGEYYKPHLLLAERYKLGFVIGSPTWRASSDWGVKLGYTHDELFALNKQSIKFIRELSRPFSESVAHIIVSGSIGPRNEGYKADIRMNAEQAKVYHLEQVKAFALADADIVTGAAISYSDEAIGIIKAARSFGLPVIISFAVETDGKLLSGESLHHAIERADKATDHYAEHYMIDCTGAEYFLDVLHAGGEWKKRIRGIQVNASLKSSAVLNKSNTPDTRDKYPGVVQLQVFELLPLIKVIGGYVLPTVRE